MCVVQLFYMRVHAWFDAIRMFFAFAHVHACDMRVKQVPHACTVEVMGDLYR